VGGSTPFPINVCNAFFEVTDVTTLHGNAKRSLSAWSFRLWNRGRVLFDDAIAEAQQLFVGAPMSESDHRILTTTVTPHPAAGGVEIVPLPIPGGSLNVRQGRASATRQRNKPKSMTPAQIRMKRIRGLLGKFGACPDPENYCHWMDQAKITLPEVCRNIPGGPKTYRDAYVNPRFAAAIRNEKSRAWSGI
jgi:hypothetical protein